MTSARPTFAAVPCADLADQAQRLRRLDPAPFLELCQMCGKSVIRTSSAWLFTLSRDGVAAGIAAGFERRARSRTSLVLALAHPLPDPEAFWAGVLGFARERGASLLMIESAGAERPAVPRLAGESSRVEATSYVLPLAGVEPAGFSKNHRRNVQRALERGAQLVSQPEDDAIRDHLRLVRASLDRRSDRGEEVPGDLDADVLHAYLGSGRAALHQAALDGQVVSSDLLVQVEGAAYYLSGGSSPEGMKAGSAHFLMSEVIGALQRAGCHSLSLGYPNAPGLARFKEGFGAQPVPVERVEARWRGPLAGALQRLLRGLRGQ